MSNVSTVSGVHSMRSGNVMFNMLMMSAAILTDFDSTTITTPDPPECAANKSSKNYLLNQTFHRKSIDALTAMIYFVL